MTDNEKLIEEIATDAANSVGGFARPGYATYDAAERAARAAFEKAHAPTRTVIQITPEAVQREYELRNGPVPTDDERVLLAEADALVESWDRRGSWDADSPVGMVMRLAAALRRTAVSEPNTETEDEMHARGATSFDCDRCGQDPEDCYCGDEPQGEPSSDQTTTLVRHLWGSTWAQGEPSDAQVEAAARAILPLLDPAWPYYSYDQITLPEPRAELHDALRAALRAAGVVNPSVGEKPL